MKSIILFILILLLPDSVQVGKKKYEERINKKGEIFISCVNTHGNKYIINLGEKTSQNYLNTPVYKYKRRLYILKESRKGNLQRVRLQKEKRKERIKQ